MNSARNFRSFSQKIVVLICSFCLLVSGAGSVRAQIETITVQADRPGARIPETLFGLFFEDINFAADGGIYPERIKNRSFEFPDPMMGWRPVKRDNFKGVVNIINRGTDDTANPRFMRIEAEAGGKGYGLSNEGFRGIGVKQGEEYKFSVYARAANRSAANLRVEIEDENGRVLGGTNLSGITSEWKNITASLRPEATHPKARLTILAEGGAAVDIDLISLYPENTFKNRPNGLRRDLVQLLKDMKPGFLRFPGGCIVEGRTLEQRYRWKTTIGELDDRRLLVNRWNTEFRHRPTPDYYQSFGLGFYEYFLLSEDIGAEPLPILNCGMACQFNSGELAALDNLEEYVQDALDLIAFANDPVTTEWGRKRAALGHPEPFKLKKIGIGNEQWGPQYVERYKVFARILKAKHPEIELIVSAGPSPNDERFNYLWNEMRMLNADIVDEHYYMEPKWFLDNVARYDDYPRSGPKVFAGEFAAQTAGIARIENRNNWNAALSEAAFMTGLERNADVVVMASYAPLFGHVDAWQWTPNMIWFDNLRSYATPNYYVQKLFSVNRGTTILPVLLNDSPKNDSNDLFASASFDEPTGEIILKVVNATASPRRIALNVAGVDRLGTNVKSIVLTAPDLNAENSLDEPARVAPVESKIAVTANKFTHLFAPNSLTVLRVGKSGRQQ
jgi:alpha-N-arabinofuranosidase